MPRGNMPRQPSRSGRQEGASRAVRVPAKTAPPRAARTSSPAAGKSFKTSAAKVAPPKKKASPAYDPTSADRVRQIIAGLDQMYPDVTCALTHRSAWELLVATILWHNARTSA